ncbi:MAG: nitroreductase family deazaflavin-dependent oxidoreductase [Chloroflexi bacterium]|nr:nitroreductase family deazaflavin-dependent oxidoreductase [Chloroflexota bacterium]MBV9898889.1 nitroreductase family deazaflavin-dependent oxidoreductase [Chloroflexota bacterium]
MPTEAQERYERNIKVIEEFRRTEGRSGAGRTLLLTTTGAKTGKERTVPVAFLSEGNRLLIFGSRAGSDKHPDWYWNLRKNPIVTVEVGAEKYQAKATPLEGEERDRLFAKQKEVMPVFADYESRTQRVIPVIALERTT